MEQGCTARENDNGEPDHATRPWLSRGAAHRAIYSVWFGCFDDITMEACFASRHEHNRSAFVGRRRARGQMKRQLGNNRADVKHCGFAVSSLLAAEWSRKGKAVSAEWRQ
ncbi:hypothetical protein NQZ68_022578 [Dissostichus eleginoides]|nr:hypothetical protein NQZ68_022578 [Dissostichus eleginoides]